MNPDNWHSSIPGPAGFLARQQPANGTGPNTRALTEDPLFRRVSAFPVKTNPFNYKDENDKPDFAHTPAFNISGKDSTGLISLAAWPATLKTITLQSTDGTPVYNLWNIRWILKYHRMLPVGFKVPFLMVVVRKLAFSKPPTRNIRFKSASLQVFDEPGEIVIALTPSTIQSFDFDALEPGAGLVLKNVSNKSKNQYVHETMEQNNIMLLFHFQFEIWNIYTEKILKIEQDSVAAVINLDAMGNPLVSHTSIINPDEVSSIHTATMMRIRNGLPVNLSPWYNTQEHTQDDSDPLLENIRRLNL